MTDVERVVLTIALHTPNRIRTAHRHNITHTMNTQAVWHHWRTLTLDRRPGEHVHITITIDGIPHGTWTADHQWPRHTAQLIADARRRIAQEVTAWRP